MAINSISLTNTPQAGDDSYSYTESTLLASSSFNNATNVIKLDVMSNDLGGNAKKLFSIDDGGTNTFLNDLLTNNVNTSWETTANGNQIRIVNGQIEFDITHSLTLANGAGNANVNALSAGETITDSFVYTIQLGNGTLSWATVNFTLVGENDSATITVNGTPDTDVIEAGGVANGTPGDPSASGDLNIVDLDAGEAKFQVVAPANLVGTYGNFVFDSNTGTWTYTLDQSKADVLNGGDAASDTLTVTSFDGTDTETITVNITGANDNATISGTNSGDVVEAGGVANGTLGTPGDSGDLNVADVDDGEAVFQAVAPASLAGTYGDFTFDETTGAWTYTLDNTDADTQALNTTDVGITDTLTVTSLDGTDSETITVNIAGANDAAVITGSASDSVIEASGVLNGTPGDATASGNLDATDVDSSAAFNVQTNVDSTYGAFSIDASGAWSYTLDDDNASVQALNTSSTPLHDLITVATADGTEQVIDVTINGANDAAVITGSASGSVTEATSSNPGTPTATGDLLATDVDNANDVFQVVAPGGATANGYGTYGVTAAGVWTYTLDNTNATVNALNDLSTPLQDTFTVLSQDGTSQLVTITINGATDVVNHAPTDITLIANDIGGNSLPGASASLGTFMTTDQDVGDTFTYSLLAGSSSGFTVGSTTGVLTTTSGLSQSTTYTLDVQTQDSGGAMYHEVFNIITGTSQGGGPSTGNDTLPSGSGGNPILVGDDVLYGSGGNDLIFGGSGNDGVFGQNGTDNLVGGAGNDTLSGGQDSDTFTWLSGDQGTTSVPAIDTIMNFSSTGNKDVLNLQDMLQGESHIGTNAGNLANYLHFSTSGGDTTVEISTTGTFSSQAVSGGTIGGADQTILLQGVNLVGANATQDAIVQNLFSNNQLITS
jgi:VCBS repeat-containing protein